MSQPFEWDSGLLAANVADFERALNRLRRDLVTVSEHYSLIGDLAKRMLDDSGLARREFDRRFRLIIAAIAGNDLQTLQSLVTHLRSSTPGALNAVRTLLPAELRHLAAPVRQDQSQAITAAVGLISRNEPESSVSTGPEPILGKYRAVALVGTSEEHRTNELRLRQQLLEPLRIRTIDELWDLAETGLCGFVVGSSAWYQMAEPDHRRAIRRISEYSTFIFARICIEGISNAVASTFLQDAAAARCGPLDATRFCHGHDCELTPADINTLLFSARLLETTDITDFFPLGLSEMEALLLRLVAANRRAPSHPITIRKLGTKELVGGRSGARVYLLSDGQAQPFVAKLDDREQLTGEIKRYRRWIEDWEPSVTNPIYHSHLGHAAISYRLQAAPDGFAQPAPTLEDSLDQLRLSEWNDTIETCRAKADGIYQAVARAADRLALLNSRDAGDCQGDDFWLHWPISNLEERSITYTILDGNWKSIELSTLVRSAIGVLEEKFHCAVVHGDIHGRNILLVDRLPAFIDFALSGPGHPLVDLVRLDAVVRSLAMRMLIDKKSMRNLFDAIYINGETEEIVLGQYPVVKASPLAVLAVKTAVKIRSVALDVARAHSLDIYHYFAMQCVVSAHVLANRNLGSGIERLMLSVLGSRLLEKLNET